MVMVIKGSSRVPRSGIADVRVRVVEAVNSGVRMDVAGVCFGVGFSTVKSWVSLARREGMGALQMKGSKGAKPKLDEGQLEVLVGLLASPDARVLGFVQALWTRAMIRELIVREFGVSYSVQAVGALLKRLGFSVQKPVVRAVEQDQVLVRGWMEREFPVIRERAKAVGASVFFGDEAGVRTDFHAGTTWARVGQTPIVRGTGSRLGVNMISAVGTSGEIHFSFLEGNCTSEAFIEFLKKLMHDIPGPVFLVVDGHSSHRSKATRGFVDEQGEKLSLFYLPPYSPELNPDEWVWKNVKCDHVAKVAPRTLGEMREAIEMAITRLRDNPSIVRGFFRDPDLAYIGEW